MIGSPVLLDLQGVSHAYRRGSPALRDVTVRLEPGVTGLVGANGAGTSTLMRVAAGALRPKAGVVRAGGLDLYGRRDRRRALKTVAWMPQNAAMPRGVSAVDYVSYLTWMRGFGAVEARKRSVAALEDVRLGGRMLDVKIGKLSGGMVRRVWLAQALACTPDILILDEPSTGLDPRQRSIMVELLAARRVETVLLSSHLLEDVVDLAGRVLVLDAGTIVYDGAPPSDADRDWLLRFIPERSGDSR